VRLICVARHVVILALAAGVLKGGLISR